MLKAVEVSFTYPGGQTGLAAASLDLAAGEKLAILGANGTGKSTLLLLLNGTLRPQSGELRLDDQPIIHDRRSLDALRARVGLVFQDPDDQLFAATVFEDVSFGPANLGLSDVDVRVRVDDALRALGLGDLAERPTHMLSFGQRKRVVLAGILAMRPDYLLLDEPTAGLDPAGVDDFLATLDGIQATGTAIAIATHDMDIAYRWADRTIVFGQYRPVLSGSPDSIFADAAALAALGLRRPLLYDLIETLIAAGRISRPSPMPRSIAAFRAHIGLE
jgi:cobalt/nickel transport system ATP-binding protein